MTKIGKAQQLAKDQERMRELQRIAAAHPDLCAEGPVNILGLPNRLYGENARHLLTILGLRSREFDRPLTHQYGRKWIKNHRFRLPEAGHKRLCAFYSNLRARRPFLRDAMKVIENPNIVSADRGLSLEFLILLTQFSDTLNTFGDVTDAQWRAKLADLQVDPRTLQCLVKLCEKVNSISTRAVMVLHEMKEILERGFILDVEFSRVILGVFFLSAISISMVPIEWAIRYTPELRIEFTAVRAVYRRGSRRTRLPTSQQLSKSKTLWRRQLEAVRQRVEQCYSQSPSAARVAHLRRQTNHLVRIHASRRLQRQPHRI